MEEINALFHGFSVALTPFNLMLMFVGVTLGIIIGVLPGLGGANGIAILLPLTFSFLVRRGISNPGRTAGCMRLCTAAL